MAIATCRKNQRVLALFALSTCWLVACHDSTGAAGTDTDTQSVTPNRSQAQGEAEARTGRHTWRSLVVALVICRRPGTFHSLMRRSGRMWRSPLG